MFHFLLLGGKQIYHWRNVFFIFPFIYNFSWLWVMKMPFLWFDSIHQIRTIYTLRETMCKILPWQISTTIFILSFSLTDNTFSSIIFRMKAIRDFPFSLSKQEKSWYTKRLDYVEHWRKIPAYRSFEWD